MVDHLTQLENLRNINGKSIGNKPPNPKRFKVLSSSVILYFTLIYILDV
jgi:hypothetical protein